MTPRISAKAARLIVDWTHKDIEELGKEFVPAIAWIVGDTDLRRPTPRLAYGVVERHKVEGRFLKCDELDCEIAQVLPDDVLKSFDGHHIEFKDGRLIFEPDQDN